MGSIGGGVVEKFQKPDFGWVVVSCNDGPQLVIDSVEDGVAKVRSRMDVPVPFL